MPQESKYADMEMVGSFANSHPDPYVQDVAIQLMAAWRLFAEILNSDMAMREEDEDETSPMLEKVRAIIPSRDTDNA